MNQQSFKFAGVTLKSLLENPSVLHPPPLQSSDQEIMQQKSKDHQAKDLVKDLESYLSGGTSNAVANAAYLGPTLWDKTIELSESELNLEYMDLDEFLSENGIPVGGEISSGTSTSSSSSSSSSSQSYQYLVHSEETEAANSREQLHQHQPQQHQPQQQLQPPKELSQHQSQQSPEQHHLQPENQIPFPISNACSPGGSSLSSDVQVDFTLEPCDVALATVPGQDHFDPRKRIFSQDELKPQPIIKKSRKIFVPDNMKDNRYWERREKNNMAAKRSRHARRIKENQITIRAAFLEKENHVLKSEVAVLKKELEDSKALIHSYEQRLQQALLPQ